MIYGLSLRFYVGPCANLDVLHTPQIVIILLNFLASWKLHQQVTRVLTTNNLQVKTKGVKKKEYLKYLGNGTKNSQLLLKLIGTQTEKTLLFSKTIFKNLLF